MCARYLVHCCSLNKSKRNQSKYIYKSLRPSVQKVHPIYSNGMIQMLKIKSFLHMNHWSWNEELLSSKCFKFIAALATISSYSLKSDFHIAFPIIFFPAISIVFWSYKLQIIKLDSNNCLKALINGKFIKFIINQSYKFFANQQSVVQVCFGFFFW